ncbi:hypothetical protein [Halalkalicoccus jeotgali]|uniref:Uncharacterized protein n=1 Tax=Halalkalicoccus jeotgali (strain DSM 18796 / CECT 7217 / JCM 14584 / KCTC 4019 / B3) TaxID=795797 RepID=D8J9D3_HALJB|nr:hypothetical protein [Halalkalicoccus jeotgali]ADJ14345.1 hypothetical protein HacjB3_04770 [Halalkalicoccus jeotgali B3]ELY40608.1 hypothetical protein C497_03137 [Halalkalicoccus jeotgali B3]
MADANRPQVSVEEHARLTENLGLGRSTGDEWTIEELRGAIDARADPEFASMGEAVRDDLADELDGELLERELSELAAQIRRLPAVREEGIPGGDSEPEVLYRELVEPGWRIYDHLVDVGFFDSVEAHLPRFTPEHIEGTANGLIRAEPLSAALEECGFDEREQTVLVMNVVNNNNRLARWTPTKDIPEEVEFNVEDVPPLQQRAMGGSLLWVKNLDIHLWQKKILITDEILDDGYWDVKAMLGGLYVMATAAHEIAEGGSLSDEQLAAALSASTAIMITNQEEIVKDMFWITEEMRKPSTLR